MKLQLPDFSSRYQRIKWGVVAVSIVLFLLLIRILKIRSDVNKIAAHPDKNVQAFLMLIRWCEGTDGPNGYKTMFTGRLFSSFLDHPRQRITSNGLTSTAAGAYQFLVGTWDECRHILGLSDFSPANQDKAAIYRIDKIRKSLPEVQAGKLAEAVQKCCQEWASMPVVVSFTDKRGFHAAGKSYYGGQPSRSLAAIRSKFAELGGVAIS